MPDFGSAQLREVFLSLDRPVRPSISANAYFRKGAVVEAFPAPPKHDFPRGHGTPERHIHGAPVGGRLNRGVLRRLAKTARTFDVPFLPCCVYPYASEGATCYRSCDLLHQLNVNLGLGMQGLLEKHRGFLVCPSFCWNP